MIDGSIYPSLIYSILYIIIVSNVYMTATLLLFSDIAKSNLLFVEVSFFKCSLVLCIHDVCVIVFHKANLIGKGASVLMINFLNNSFNILKFYLIGKYKCN